MNEIINRHGETARTGTFGIRGPDTSRLENLTDAVFAIAITLLAVSLQVPGSFNELLNSMKGFLAFGVTLGTLIGIWYTHYMYFRRYRFIDRNIIVLNSLLIFVVLFYIYPLKYLANILINYQLMKRVLGVDIDVEISILSAQTKDLMIIYGLGFLLIFLIFGLMYFYAYRKREALNLSPLEILHTVNSIRAHGIYAIIAFISLLIAWVGGQAYIAWSGWIYFMIGPMQWLNGIHGRRKRKKLFPGSG